MQKTHKRKIKNFFIDRPFQSRAILNYVALSAGLLGIILVIFETLINQTRVIIANVNTLPINSQLQIDSSLQKILTISLLFFLISIFVSILYGVVVSHRVAGPMHAILKYIDLLRSGKYDEKRPLRPGDELEPIMNSLHELALELKKNNIR